MSFGARYGFSLNTRLVSASTPPSPLLSARRMMPTYLTLMTSVSDQKIRESTPSTFGPVTLCAPRPSKQARSEYSGLVPMSPNTTPIAATDKEIGTFPRSSSPIRPAEPSPATVIRTS
jgi:hypothetical protein